MLIYFTKSISLESPTLRSLKRPQRNMNRKPRQQHKRISLKLRRGEHQMRQVTLHLTWKKERTERETERIRRRKATLKV